MGVLHYAQSNLRKNKSNSVSLAILVLLVSMLMSIGLTFITQTGSAYDLKADELHSPHVMYGVPKNDFKPDYETYLQNDARVIEYNREQVVYMPQAKVSYGGLVDIGVLLQNKDTHRTISPFKLVEEDTAVPPDNAIYLPYFAKTLGYGIGEEYTIEYRNKPYSFSIAGFFEATEMMQINVTLKYFLSEAAFDRILDEIGETVLLTAVLDDRTKDEDFISDFENANNIAQASMLTGKTLSAYYSNFKLNTIMQVLIFSGVLVGFAAIAIVISLIVINFRVKNSIEDRMRNIGVLGAAGYTSGQIKTSFILEYALIALPAALLGVLTSVLMMPLISSVLLNMTGIFFHIDIQIALGLLASVLIACVLILMVLISSRRIKKLPPVVALRGGLATHSFRRNHFPLHKGLGNVHVRLGFKNMFSYGGLYSMIGFVLMGIAVIISFMWATFANFSLDRTAIIKMAALESADVTVTVTRHTDIGALAAEIETMEDVRKTSQLDFVAFNMDGNKIILAFTSDDYSRMETVQTFEGSMPQLENEVAIPKVFAQNLGKGIGDLVLIEYGGVEQEYLVSGFFSTTNTNGAALTVDGFRRINPAYECATINIYLNDGVTVEQFSAKLKECFGVVNVPLTGTDGEHATAKARAEEKISAYMEQYGIDSVEYAVIYNGEIIIKGGSAAYQIEKITDWKAYVNASISSISSGVTVLMIFVFVVGLLMISIILFMTTKSILFKRRAELGIMKAGGYQTKELVAQMALSFLPAALAGSVLGGILGALSVNPVFLAVFSAAGGVSTMDLNINPISIAVICLLLTAATLGVVTLSALRIKDISAYELMSE